VRGPDPEPSSRPDWCRRPRRGLGGAAGAACSGVRRAGGDGVVALGDRRAPGEPGGVGAAGRGSGRGAGLRGGRGPGSAGSGRAVWAAGGLAGRRERPGHSDSRIPVSVGAARHVSCPSESASPAFPRDLLSPQTGVKSK
jgi:hypothetical protein